MKKKTEPKPPVESFAERAGLLKNRKAGRRMILFLAGSDDEGSQIRFELAEILLKDRGHIVINPAKNTSRPGSSWMDELSEDLSLITELGGYNRLLHGQLSIHLPNLFFPLPAVCIIDNKFAGSTGREMIVRYANIRGIPTMRIESFVVDFGCIVKQAVEEGGLK